MSADELRDALDGLFAYDSGAVDSGIHDEALRARVIQALRDIDMAVLSRIVREMFLDDEALRHGYGLEDVASFIAWLAERMDFDLR